MVRHQARPGVHVACGSLSPALPGVDVTVSGAEGAEHTVTGLTEQQLLVGVGGALGDNLPPLPGHQVPQLVDEEGGRQRLDPARGNGDQLPTHRAPGGRHQVRSGNIMSDQKCLTEFPRHYHKPELGVPGEGGDYPGKALDADCVRAGQQLGIVLRTIVIT